MPRSSHSPLQKYGRLKPSRSKNKRTMNRQIIPDCANRLAELIL
jgi:hypothetical protein